MVILFSLREEASAFRLRRMCCGARNADCLQHRGQASGIGIDALRGTRQGIDGAQRRGNRCWSRPATSGAAGTPDGQPVPGGGGEGNTFEVSYCLKIESKQKGSLQPRFAESTIPGWFARIKNWEGKMEQQDSRRSPLESPKERPEPRPMRWDTPPRRFPLPVRAAELSASARAAAQLSTAPSLTPVVAPHC